MHAQEERRYESLVLTYLDSLLLSPLMIFSPQGCVDGVQDWLKDNLGIILGVCTGVAVVEVSHSLIHVPILSLYADSFRDKATGIFF